VLVVCFIPVVPLVVIQSWCTRHPPNEQLLISVGVGALLIIVIVVVVVIPVVVICWSVPIVHPSLLWGWVLLVCFIPVIPVVPLIVVQSWCTHHPPDEQLLVGMGVGAGAGAGSAPSPSSLVVVWPWCTHHPPDKQLLVGMWMGVCFANIVPCSLFHL
jgi:hypothetical protein